MAKILKIEDEAVAITVQLHPGNIRVYIGTTEIDVKETVKQAVGVGVPIAKAFLANLLSSKKTDKGTPGAPDDTGF